MSTGGVVRLDGIWRLTLRVRRCPNHACPQYHHQPDVPEEAVAWVLPHADFGLDVIALVGYLRYREVAPLWWLFRTFGEANRGDRGR